jgi:hypothetical protein
MRVICLADPMRSLIRLGPGNHTVIVEPSDLACPETEDVRQDLVGVLSDAWRTAGGLTELRVEYEG